MRVLLTSAGLETEEIKEYFVDMAGKRYVLRYVFNKSLIDP